MPQMQFQEIDENFVVMLGIDSLKFIVENLSNKNLGIWQQWLEKKKSYFKTTYLGHNLWSRFFLPGSDWKV